MKGTGPAFVDGESSSTGRAISFKLLNSREKTCSGLFRREPETSLRRTKKVRASKECTDMNPNPIQDLAERLSQVLPPGLASARDELRDNFRAVLQAQLADLDLVSREQFEVQKELLLRLRSRLSELEGRVKELEQQPPG